MARLWPFIDDRFNTKVLNVNSGSDSRRLTTEKKTFPSVKKVAGYSTMFVTAMHSSQVLSRSNCSIGFRAMARPEKSLNV
jgi:hypothetical protein